MNNVFILLFLKLVSLEIDLNIYCINSFGFLKQLIRSLRIFDNFWWNYKESIFNKSFIVCSGFFKVEIKFLSFFKHTLKNFIGDINYYFSYKYL